MQQNHLSFCQNQTKETSRRCNNTIDMPQTKMVGKVDVLENGQPVNLLPKGDNVLGLPLDQPGPIVLNNEPERSLRPGEQMPSNLADPIKLKERDIEVNP